MPKFTVYVQRQIFEYNSFEVEAVDEVHAKTLADKFIGGQNMGYDEYDEYFHNGWEQSDGCGETELMEIIKEDETKTVTVPQSHLDWIAL